MKNQTKTNNKELLIGLILLAASFFVRVYGYLFGNVGMLPTWTMWGSVGVLFLMAFMRLRSLRNIFYNPLLNVTFMFWFWTFFVTVLNMKQPTTLVMDIITLSFGFIFLMSFSYSTNDMNDNDVAFIQKFSAVFILLLGGIYILWIVGGGNIYAPGALNSVYYILMLLPIVFMQKNKVIIAAEIGVIFAAVLLSGKRTAFIVLIAALILPNIFFIKNGDKKRGKQILMLIFILISLFVVYNYMASRYDIEIFDRLESLSEDEGSGRLAIYKETIEGFNNSSFFGKLLGHGFNGVAYDRIVMPRFGWTTDVNATSAHNDFLEILYDYGIVGLFMYFAIIIRLLKNLVALRKRNLDYFKMYMSAFVSFMVMSMFSHLIIYPTYIAFLWMFFSMGNSILMKKEAKDENTSY